MLKAYDRAAGRPVTGGWIALVRSGQSARGLAHAQTLRVSGACGERASVLECGGPPPLWPAPNCRPCQSVPVPIHAHSNFMFIHNCFMMPLARNGKIARLPKPIREELNRRLDQGTPGGPLLQWLNSLPEVQVVLAADFGGRPINKQSLSQWRHGGYAEWLRLRETRTLAGQILAEARELQPAGRPPLTDQLSTWVLIRYLMVVRNSSGRPARNERISTFCTTSAATSWPSSEATTSRPVCNSSGLVSSSCPDCNPPPPRPARRQPRSDRVRPLKF